MVIYAGELSHFPIYRQWPQDSQLLVLTQAQDLFRTWTGFGVMWDKYVKRWTKLR